MWRRHYTRASKIAESVEKCEWRALKINYKTIAIKDGPVLGSIKENLTDQSSFWLQTGQHSPVVVINKPKTSFKVGYILTL